MNHNKSSPPVGRRRKGMALIMVLAILALATVLLLGLFSVSEADYKGSKTYVAGQNAKGLAETAVDVVIAQIQNGTRQEGNVRTFHATQPGAVRKYNASGSFIGGYKLYSDSQMVVTGTGASAEQSMVNASPPDGWNSADNKDRYVDLNEPVVRPSRSGSGALEVYFPVIDPRAAYDQSSSGGPRPVEGFEYSNKPLSGTALAGVVTPQDTNNPDDLRLPMPVEWIYLLKDGTLGYLNGKKFVSTSGTSSASAENPIVGRVAFWTDDETCKVNINTASEPTFWGVPTLMHERDWRFAEYPPAMHEYQRFPGHPATVALSSIFYPSVNMDILAPGANVNQIRDIKERIYEIVPKVNLGGSRGGTVPFGAESFADQQAVAVDVALSRRERLFASLDELLFSETAQSGLRKENDFVVGGTRLLDAKALERARFFLSAHSRGSDVNFLGMPKVSMWPIADETKGDDFRTGFDKMLAFCSDLDPANNDTANTYYFRRRNAHSATEDIQLRRNDELMSFLDKLMAKTMPAGSSGNGQSFVTKYGQDDSRQILVQIFDYIRTTNLYDAMLAKPPAELQNLSSNGKSGDYKWQYENKPQSSKTYTEERFKTTRTGTDIDTDEIFTGTFPGHGTVSPTEWSQGSKTYRGIGRFPTISEVALHFICTGDGNNDEGSWGIPEQDAQGAWKKPLFNPLGTNFSGGKTAKKYKIDVMRGGGAPVDPRHSVVADDWARERYTDLFLGTNQKAVWYSNYPPFPQDPNGRGTIDTRQPPLYGTQANAAANSPLNPVNHPGYNPANWNATLQRGVPLKANEKRVQACLHLESFVPALGWTKIHPEVTYVLDGSFINQIQLKNAAGQMVSLFSTTSSVAIKSRSNMYDGNSSHPVGGVGNFRSFAVGKHVKGVGSMPADPNYLTSATGAAHRDIDNMDLVSSFVTVAGDKMEFVFPSNYLKILVYDTHDWENAAPVQEVRVAFPTGTQYTKVPELVTFTSLKDTWESGGTTYNQRITDATRWWSFNFAGAMNRYQGKWVGGSVSMTPREAYLTSTNAMYNELLRSSGRLRMYDHTSNSGQGALSSTGIDGRYLPQTYSFIWGFDPNNSNFKGVNPRLRDPSASDDAWGTDVIRSVMPRHGDYRVLAAKKIITEDMWIPNPMWTNDPTVAFAHSLSAHNSDAEPGFHRGAAQYGITDNSRRLVQNANYGSNQIPDMPGNDDATKLANAYGDFDNGVGTSRDGAYINKPDEGNLSQLQKNFGGDRVNVRNAYYLNAEYQAAATEAFFTPNRMVASPVMFGSLPTGVWGSRPVSSLHSSASSQGVPWRTLLFRPHTKYTSIAASQSAHPGSSIHANAQGATPADHYLLEMFRMPVVEPYAISDSFSTAGKINLNYQMVPFTNIKRATALHALMKGELLRTVPRNEANLYKNWRQTSSTDWESYLMHSENAGTARYWHRTIDVLKTLQQFEERFNFTATKMGTRGLLRTASQLCEMHLIPSRTARAGDSSLLPDTINASNRESIMARFWEEHGLTGDNMREAPYSNLYARATTQSNVFKVYMRAQVIQKSRSSAADEFDSTLDTVSSEYRGSSIVERYIDANDKRRPLPDYAVAQDPFAEKALSDYYRFRVLENKRFVP